MAIDSNAGTNIGSSHFPQPSTPLFKPFEWIQSEGLDLPQQKQAAFLNNARDVVQGAQTLIQLLVWDEDRREAVSSDADAAPLFDECQRDALQRLLAASLGLLHAQIEDQCEALTG
jgi:hypothetical protein